MTVDSIILDFFVNGEVQRNALPMVTIAVKFTGGQKSSKPRSGDH
jgi:hypothetical protein